MPERTVVDGQVRTIHHDRRIAMIELAKGNSSFVVEGNERPAESAARKPGRPRMPKTAIEYRSYAQAWFAAADDAEDMADRWESETELREKCGCGEDDTEYLNSFYQAKHHELRSSS